MYYTVLHNYSTIVVVCICQTIKVIFFVDELQDFIEGKKAKKKKNTIGGQLPTSKEPKNLF